MKEINFFDQYSQAVEMAECRIADFEKFNEIYSFEDRQYFMEKLTEMGYKEDDVCLYELEDVVSLIKRKRYNSFSSMYNSIVDVMNQYKEEIEFIWDRYYKSEKKHRRNVIGTGLGLSIVKNIFEIHKLEYGVNSKESEGSTFYFKIKKVNNKK